MGLDAAIPCGLIISELVSSTLKQSKVEGKLKIRVRMHTDENGVTTLEISTEGTDALGTANFRKSGSLPLMHVHALTKELGGQLEWDNPQAVLRVVFPPASRQI